MARSTVKFDWSLLDRQGLINFMQLLKPEIVGKSYKIAEIHRLLSGHIKKYLPVKIVKKTDIKVDFGYIYVGGTYYSDADKGKKKCIELCLVYNPFEEIINFTAKKYRAMCVTLADTLLHEIIHMRQFRRRKFKYLPDYASTAEKTEQRKEQSYLGCSDEIDAYSFNIACELMDKFKNSHNQVSKYLNVIRPRRTRKTGIWHMYLKAFDYDHNHTIIKKVKTKVIRYLPKAEIGKPYKNKDWIWR